MLNSEEGYNHELKNEQEDQEDMFVPEQFQMTPAIYQTGPEDFTGSTEETKEEADHNIVTFGQMAESLASEFVGQNVTIEEVIRVACGLHPKVSDI